eukprot:NODE_1203_length_642_cov_222.319846_g1194_i0.p1 GENE.NODE_1203_length_642_cov_222.319846_g1194_i0~~NODE_1203_length_642_cov_222.319846_g1194_i0.p1  ORF type:complete len:188 (+),score=36.79 NODE_1203_length_642_cov_222.319846_g1194_i0:78-566(+)
MTDDFTADVLEKCSDDIQNIAKALSEQLGIDMAGVPKMDEMQKRFYKGEVEDESGYKTIFCSNRGYAGLFAPMLEQGGGWVPDFKYRYLTEDIPLGQCILKGYADLCGIKVPTIDMLIEWSQKHMGKEYIKDGALTGKDAASTPAPQSFGITSMDILRQKAL